ncbi:MAG: mechanosensitive ion channel family protein [Lachnospiraceae bacterium]|nr:mechanosensitive ion channel family protein [Lachnospiraceae bacterium]
MTSIITLASNLANSEAVGLSTDAANEFVEEVTETATYFQTNLPALQALGIKLLIAVCSLLIGHKLIQVIRKIFQKAAARTGVDITAAHFFSSVLNAALHILLIFAIAAQMGFNTGTIIAIITSAMVTVGLALKDSLSHFAGGILILFMHPFKVGDYIICSAGEGTVRAIGLVYTTITTLDNCQISIPNGTLASDNVRNCSSFPFRRVDLFVSIGYDEDIKKAKEVLYRAYKDNPNISTEHEIKVFVSELGESAIILGGQGYVAGSRYLQTKWEVNEGIKLAFDAAGITIPYNQLDLHLK